MCRTGGPRCTKHAQASYDKAMDQVRAIGRDYDAGTSAEQKKLLPKLTKAVGRAQDAQRPLATTTGGLTDLARQLQMMPAEDRAMIDRGELLSMEVKRYREGYATRLAQLQAHDVAAGKPPRQTLGLVVDGREWDATGHPSLTVDDFRDQPGFTVIDGDTPEERDRQLRAALGMNDDESGVGPVTMLETDPEGQDVLPQQRKFTLTNAATGRSWAYDTESQLTTAATLMKAQNPAADIHLDIDGRRFSIARPATSHRFELTEI